MRLPAWIAACLLAASAAAAAEPVVFSSPAPSESLRAGGEIEVRWSGVPSDTEEMELLLSLDGGERVALRLTSEIPASARSFLWKVPNLDCSRASLVLRVGTAARETVAGASAPFAIVPDASLDFASVAARSGELWLASAADPSDLLPPAGVSAGQEGWNGFTPDEKPVFASSAPVLPLPSRTRSCGASRTAARFSVERASDGRAPLPAPILRI